MSSESKSQMGELLPFVNVFLLLFAIIISYFLIGSWAIFFNSLVFLCLFAFAGAVVWSLRNDASDNASLPEGKVCPFLGFALSFLLGISLFIIFFILARFVIPDLTTIIYLFFALIFLFTFYRLLVRRNFPIKNPDISFFSSTQFTALSIFFIAAVFLISGNIVYSSEGIYFKDALHGTYEISNSKSLSWLPDTKDLSYNGKDLRYNFGAPILIYLLENSFNIPALTSVYIVLPLIFILVFLTLFYSFAFEITGSSRAALAAAFTALFASLLFLPLEIILGFPQHALLSRLTFMSSFGLGFSLVLGFLLSGRKDEAAASGSFSLTPVQYLFILALALTKTAIAIPIILAVLGVSVVYSMRERSISSLIQPFVVFVPLVIYVLAFMSGAHSHNLWVFFPGFFKLAASASQLNGILLFLFPLVSLVATLVLLFGFALPFILSGAVSFLSKSFASLAIILGFRKNSSESPLLQNSILLDACIFFSLILSVFLVEVTENNNYQFVVPGFLIGIVFLFRWLSSISFLQKIPAIILTVVLFISGVASAFLIYVPSVGFALPTDAGGLNPATELNLKVVSLVASFKDSGYCSDSVPCPVLFGWTFYDSSLIHALNYLNQNTTPDSIVLFGRQYEFADSVGRTASFSWYPSSIIRTAISGKQAVIEQYKPKGILMQFDYTTRSMNTLKFYLAVIDPQTISNKTWSRFMNSFSSAAETGNKTLAYANYFALYKKDNFFIREHEFISAVSKLKPLALIGMDIAAKKEIAFNYIPQYAPEYLVFEDGELPAEWFIEEYNLEKVFLEGGTSIYRVQTFKVQ